MSGLSIRPNRGDIVRLDTGSGPVLITVLAPGHCRLKIQAPPSVRIWRPEDHPAGPPPRTEFDPPSVYEVRSRLILALDQLNRSEGGSAADTARIDQAGAILGDLIRRLDPREGRRNSA